MDSPSSAPLRKRASELAKPKKKVGFSAVQGDIKQDSGQAQNQDSEQTGPDLTEKEHEKALEKLEMQRRGTFDRIWKMQQPSMTKQDTDSSGIILTTQRVRNA